MLKNSLLAAGAAIAVIASSSMPASAVGCPSGQIPNPSGFGCVDVEPVPEPLTILGSVAVGGALLGKKVLGSKNADK